MMTIGEILKHVRQSKGLSLNAVCKSVNYEITKSQLSKVERGVQDCSWIFMRAASAGLNIPIEIFTEKVCSSTDLDDRLQAKKMTRNIVPVLNWLQIEAGNHQNRESHHYIDGPSDLLPGCFALELQCDDMESFNGGPSFPKGSMLFFDPNRRAVENDYVLAVVDGEATFKQLRQVRDGQHLRPLNNQYPVIKMAEGDKIIGRLVATRQLF